MNTPILPPVPDVVYFEDEPAIKILQEWAENYATAWVNYTMEKVAKELAKTEDRYTRLKFPGTTGS